MIAGAIVKPGVNGRITEHAADVNGRIELRVWETESAKSAVMAADRGTPFGCLSRFRVAALAIAKTVNVGCVFRGS
jgi:hypothetical protein